MIRISIYQLLVLLLAGCIDRIDVDTSTEPERLIVEGFITDEIKEHQIKLTKTIQFSNERNTPVTGAQVSVISSDGDTECFEETLIGTYTSCYDFQAKANVAYKLRIEWEGKTIESTEQILPVGKQLDSIIYTPGSRLMLNRADNLVISREGVNISVTLPVVNDVAYYRWFLIPTFVFEAELESNPVFRRCWITTLYDFTDLYIHKDLEGGYNLEIAFIPTSWDMVYDYSLLIRQFNISEEAFNYWNSVKKQKKNTGSIFDTPPFSISGNLFNVENPSENILGYFGVYHVSEGRIRWNFDDLPFEKPQSSPCDFYYRGEPSECRFCLDFPRGKSTFDQPDWWE